MLACFGLVVIYRIDETLAREQAQWFVVGLVLFAATIVFLRDFRVLERYRYTVAAAGLLLLLLPRVPGIGQQVNGAYLGVGVGPISFQPAEFGKIAIVIFLAAYLRDTRQVLVQGARRFAGITLPPLKHLGPLLVIWGGAMVMLVFIRDLGSSLMFFGGFLALLYVATNRFSFVAIGLGLFALGAWFFASTVGHVQNRIDTWRDPFDPALYGEGGRLVPDRAVAVRAGRRRAVRDGLRAGDDHPAERLGDPAGAADRPDLRGDHERARAGGRLRAAARLPDGRRARLQDRDARAGLVLQAARRRADRGVRAAGVRDRRRA